MDALNAITPALEVGQSSDIRRPWAPEGLDPLTNNTTQQQLFTAMHLYLASKIARNTFERNCS